MLRFPHCLDNRLTDGGNFFHVTSISTPTKQLLCWYYFIVLETKGAYHSGRTTEGKNCLCQIGSWVQISLEGRMSVLSWMRLAVLQRADAISRESYRLRGIKKSNNGQDPTKYCRTTIIQFIYLLLLLFMSWVNSYKANKRHSTMLVIMVNGTKGNYWACVQFQCTLNLSIKPHSFTWLLFKWLLT
jgi:hypothetical protein